MFTTPSTYSALPSTENFQSARHLVRVTVLVHPAQGRRLCNVRLYPTYGEQRRGVVTVSHCPWRHTARDSDDTHLTRAAGNQAVVTQPAQSASCSSTPMVIRLCGFRWNESPSCSENVRITRRGPSPPMATLCLSVFRWTASVHADPPPLASLALCGGRLWSLWCIGSSCIAFPPNHGWCSPYCSVWVS